MSLITPANSSSLRAEVIADFARLEALADDWERLRAQGRRPEIFMSLAWSRACWRAFGAQRKLHAVVVFDGPQPVAILPLAVEAGTLRFLTSPEADYNDLLASQNAPPGVLQSALEALLASRLHWDRCILENIAEGSNLEAILGSLPQQLQARLITASVAECPALVFGEDRDAQFKAIFAASRNRQYLTRLRRKGEIRFRHLESEDDIRHHLPRFFEQHVCRWAMAGVRSQFCNPAQRRLYETLLRELGPNLARFSVLELDGRAVAYHFGFQAEGKYIFYKPTFDIELWDDSPGTVLLLHLLQHTHEAGLREFDFATGGEWYKSRFANRTHTSRTLVLFRSRARATAEKLGSEVKAMLKGQPWARKRLQALAAAARRLHSAVRRKGPVNTLRLLARRAQRAVISRDELLVFALDRSTLSLTAPAKAESSAIELGQGSLADLAAFISQHLDSFDPDRLRRARERIKQGDHLYLTRRGGEIVHIAWLGARHDIAAEAEIGTACKIRLQEPASVIYDCWTPPGHRGKGYYQRTLRELAGIALSKHEQVFIACLTTNAPSRRGILAAGFQSRHRMGRIRILGHFERNWTA